MARYSYERLSSQDNAFLMWETPNLPMHTSALQIFDATSLATPSGGVDFARIRDHFASKLHLMPTYRQKLMWIPREDHAVWVDDPEFSLDYHVRHTALPRPGSPEQLQRLASRIMEQPLDRSRPLWETWVVEGLEGNRFALISKQHHSLIDGSSGADLMTSLMSFEPTDKTLPAPRFLPRPLPSPGELWMNEVGRKLAAPLDLAQRAWRFVRETEDLGTELSQRGNSFRDLLGWYAAPASDTPINGPVGPHRRFASCDLSLEMLMEVRRALRCSVNDVVLTIVTGALRDYMIERRVKCDQLDFRVSTPVDVRRPDETGSFGNRVSSWIVRLPLAVSDPVEQLEEIRKATRELKGTHQAEAVELVTDLVDWLPVDVPSAASKSTNCIVTNVRGPRDPLYMLGAEQLAVYPQPPLMMNQGLAIGVLSYSGTLCWGLNADADRVPDLDSLVDAIQRAARRLAAAAHVEFSIRGKAATPRPELNGAAPSAAGGTKRRTPVAILPSDARCDENVCPSELRELVCSQHEALRGLLTELDDQAALLLAGESDAGELTLEVARALHEQLVAHLDFEDRYLVPALREVDAWGEERARAVEEEHRDQRERLRIFLDDLEVQPHPSVQLAKQLRRFVADMRTDMAGEEAGVVSEELLRDDVVAVQAEVG